MDKDNVVNRNRVFEETLKKERKAFYLREDFTLNPKKMNTIPPKPNYVRRGEMPPEISKKLGLEVKSFESSEKELLNATLKETKKVPTQKYDQPLTTAHEIGWMSVSHGHMFRERKQRGLKNNAITKFAEKYVTDMGVNPFQKKSGAAQE